MKRFAGAADQRRSISISRSSDPLIAAGVVVLATLLLMLIGGQFGRPGMTFAVEDPQVGQALVRFHNLERNEQDAFRWAQPLAGIFLYGFEGRPALLSLRLTAPRPADQPAPTLAIGNANPSRFVVGPEWRRYHVMVPTDPDGETALRLLTTPAYVPENDPRELGVVLSTLHAEPLLAQPVGLPARSMYLLTLPLIGWLLAWRLGLSPRRALGPALALAGVVGLAQAFPTPSSYWLPTLGWPWWPILPLAFLLIAPALGRRLDISRELLQEHRTVGWVGLGLALLALLAIRAGMPALPAGALAIAGIWAGQTVLTHEPDTAMSPPLILWGLLGSLAIALLLRLFNLEGQPAGLWRDESRHALQALQIWEDPTYRPIYVVAGADLPALLFYLMAPVLGLFGPHVWDARLVSALAGALTPLALFWATKPLIGRRPAIFAAALYAWASWSLSMSRWAFPATLDHVLVLTAVGLVWRALGPARAGGPLPRRAIAALTLAGLLGGLATYAYHTGRIAPLALAVVAGVRLGVHSAAWRRALPGLIVAAMVGLLTMAPLIWYIASDLDGYNRRVGNVSVFDSNDLTTHTPAGLFLRNVERYLLMWHVEGESNGRHHLPGVPMLDPFTGLLLVLGLVAAFGMAMSRRGVLALLLFWLIYFVPGVFSGNAPHAMRALGTLAPACALAGLGLTILNDSLRSTRFHRMIPVTVLTLSLAFNVWIYFGVMRVDPLVYGEFDLTETAAGRMIQAADRADVPVFLPTKLLATDTVRYLSYNAQPRRLESNPIPADGPALVLLPPGASAALQEEVKAALGSDVITFAPPHTPDGTEPVLLIFGRGEATQALVTP